MLIECNINGMSFKFAAHNCTSSQATSNILFKPPPPLKGELFVYIRAVARSQENHQWTATIAKFRRITLTHGRCCRCVFFLSLSLSKPNIFALISTNEGVYTFREPKSRGPRFRGGCEHERGVGCRRRQIFAFQSVAFWGTAQDVTSTETLSLCSILITCVVVVVVVVRDVYLFARGVERWKRGCQRRVKSKNAAARGGAGVVGNSRQHC